MMGHGYMPATSMKNNRGTNLDEQDLEEQRREEAYSEAWETSLWKAQDMITDNVGMPTHNAWQLQYGNMDVFKQLSNSKPEIVILLDNSSSTRALLTREKNIKDEEV